VAGATLTAQSQNTFHLSLPASSVSTVVLTR
jgi:O-glycosyl hydrolase